MSDEWGPAEPVGPPISDLTSRPWLARYAAGVPADIAVTEESLCDMLDGAVARFADLVALDFYGATTTYRSLGDQVARDQVVGPAVTVLEHQRHRAGMHHQATPLARGDAHRFRQLADKPESALLDAQRRSAKPTCIDQYNPSIRPAIARTEITRTGLIRRSPPSTAARAPISPPNAKPTTSADASSQST